jgi:hypothetical protein
MANQDQVLGSSVPFTNFSILREKGWAKTTLHVLSFLYAIFFSWAILSTGGAAVISWAFEWHATFL